MKQLLADIPKKVMISTAVIVAVLISWLILLPLLGGSLDAAEGQNRRLKGEMEQIRKNLAQSKTDQDYVKANQAEYEALVKSDKLVPHTRRAAVVELTNVAHAQGLTALNYSFNAAPANSVTTAASQPKSAAYTVSVENIVLKVGAPYDGPIYRFLADTTASFPGSVVIESLELKRANEITALALEAVSRGQDSQLVTGDISLIWRTAQAQEQKDAGKAK